MRQAASATVLILCAAALTIAVQQSPAPFAHERAVLTAGTGPRRLGIDLVLMSRAASFRVVQHGGRAVAEAGLADLRLFGPAGDPVPYLLAHAPAREPDWVTGRLLPLAVTKTSSGFEADLGGSHDVDALRVEGLPAPFLKRLVLEGSGDRTRWTVLAPEATLFDLPEERLAQTTVSFPSGRFRYLRVRWDDRSTGRVPLPRDVAARRAGGAPPPDPMASPLAFEPRASEPGRSRYLVRLPAPRLPIVALQLDVGSGHVFRPVAIMESRLSGGEAAPVELGRSTLIRVVRDGVAASSLRVAMNPPSEAELELVIEDGSNAPLELSGIAAVFAELPWIYFEAPGGEVIARYGAAGLDRPSYDLEAVRDSLDLFTVQEASWGEPRALTEGGDAGVAPSLPEAGAEIDAAPFRYTRGIPDATGLAALTLDASALAHSRGPSARFRDLRVLDESNRQIPYIIERRDEPLSVGLTIEQAQPVKTSELGDAGARQSLYRVALPASNMPPSRVVLETAARVFQRQVRIGVERPPDRRHRDAWFEVVASARWRHADQQTPAPALALNVGTLDSAELVIVVDEGDNAPLPIVSARLLLPSYRVRFYHPGTGSLRLAYGRSDLQVPQYDLALLAPHVMGAAAHEITAGPEPVGSAAGADAFISSRVFWILLGGAVLVLLLLIARLVRGEARS